MESAAAAAAAAAATTTTFGISVNFQLICVILN